MNEKITVVAYVEAKPEHVDTVKSELIKLVEPTRQEEGCIQYDLHQDQANENVFIFVENWESKALLQQHLASEHIASYIKATDGLVDKFVINETSQIA